MASRGLVACVGGAVAVLSGRVADAAAVEAILGRLIALRCIVTAPVPGRFVSAVVAALDQDAIARELVLVGGSLVALGRGLIAVGCVLVTVRRCLVAVSRCLITVGSGHVVGVRWWELSHEDLRNEARELEDLAPGPSLNPP